MDALAALALQIEWGADEALAGQPVDRRAARPPPRAEAAAPAPVPARPAATAPQEQAEALALAAQNLEALRSAIAGFEGCALRHTATTLVFAEGDPAARVMLVTDVPGAAEDRAGTPFAGPNAALLGRMLASIGLTRQDVYTASLLPWRPPGDRKPAEAEIRLCLPFFWRHLALARPRTLLLLGPLGARILLPAPAGRRPRPGWHALAVPGLAEPVPTLLAPSLAATLASPAAKQEAWASLILLRRAWEAGDAQHRGE